MVKIKENIGFLIVGAIGVVINFIVYKSFLWLGIPNDYSWFCGIVVSAQSNYLLNAKFVFRSE